MAWTTYNQNLPTSVRIDGKDLREFGLELVEYPDSLFLPPVERQTLTIPRRHGAFDLGAVYQPKEFTLTFQVWAPTHQEAMEKRDAFLRWIQLPANTREYVILGQKVRAHRLELVGHGYQYSEGTVSVSAGSRDVTGTNVDWSNKVFPGDIIWISGEAPKLIAAVTSSTTLQTLTAFSNAHASASYYITRRRVLLCNVSGSATITTMSGRGFFKDKVFRISIPFVALFPFWVGDEVLIEQEDVSDESFFSVFQPGNMFVNPIFEVSTKSTSLTGLKLAVAKYASLVTFDSRDSVGNLSGVKNLLGESVNGYVAEALRFLQTNGKIGLAIHGRPDGTSGDAVKFTSMFDGQSVPTTNGNFILPQGAADRINYNQGTVLIDFTPLWDGNDNERHALFRNTKDDDNQVYILKNPANNLVAYVNGAYATLPYSSHQISAGSTYRLIITWDAGQQIKLFLGTSLDSTPEATSSANAGTPTSAPMSDSVLGSSASGENSADSVILREVIWDIPLDPTNDIANKLSTPDDDPTTVHPEHIIAGFDFTGETANTIATGYRTTDWALAFNGSNQYINAGGDSSLKPSSQASAFVRMKVDTLTSGYGTFLSIGNASDQDIVLVYDSNGLFAFNLRLSSGWTTCWSTAQQVFENEWMTLGGSYDGNYIRIYKNGQLVRSVEASGSIQHDADNFLNIGRATSNVNYFAGYISEIYFFNRALTQSEFEQLTAGLTPDQVLPDYSTACVLDYRFDSGSANWDSGTTSVLDQSNFNNDGTLVNFTWTGSYPDSLVEAYVGKKGFCGQRTEVIDTWGGTYVYVGSASGFNSGDVVCCWDEAGNRAICEISTIDYDEENDRYQVNFSSVSWDNGTTLSGTKKFMSKNILGNPDFEEGTTHWSGGTAAIDNVKVNAQSLNPGGSNITQTLALPGSTKSYTLRAWAYRSTAGSAVLTLGSVSLTQSIAAGEWKQLEVTSERSGSTTITLGSGGERWDAVQLYENKVPNPSFESGTAGSAPTNWTVIGANTFQVDTTNYHAGSQSVYAASTAGGGCGRTTNTVLSANDGKWYELTAWIKASAGSIYLGMRKSSDGSNFVQTEQINATTWTRVSLVFKNTSDSAMYVAVYTTAGGSGYVDDVSLREIYDVPLQITPMDAAYRFLPAKHEYGALVNGSSEVVIEDVPGSPYQASITVRFKPLFPADTNLSEDIVIAKWVDSTGNYGYRIVYKPGNDAFALEVIESNSVVYTVNGQIRTFSADSEWIEVTATYDKDDANNCDLYYNGLVETTSRTGSLTTLSSNPTRFIIPAGANIIVDEVLLAVKALDADEVQANYLEYSTSTVCEFVFEPRAIHYNGTIAPGDVLKLDFENETYTLYDASANSESSALNDISNPASKLILTPESDNKNWVYVETSSGNADFKIKFKPLWL